MKGNLKMLALLQYLQCRLKTMAQYMIFHVLFFYLLSSKNKLLSSLNNRIIDKNQVKQKLTGRR